MGLNQVLDCGTDFVIVVDDTDYRHFILLPRLLALLQLTGAHPVQDASLFQSETGTQRSPSFAVQAEMLGHTD